ncbi:hypothetical protein CIPAW_12G141400 [Carya illinoinensis]|uniref:Secreted protein n=1 Tax=Carya illinoinensis TaxID=32201 RepID=A0A8T1P1K3_CARIL|nr:hypothetical protein CIPAW_12G141400 [Carya illinoinensis]
MVWCTQGFLVLVLLYAIDDDGVSCCLRWSSGGGGNVGLHYTLREFGAGVGGSLGNSNVWDAKLALLCDCFTFFGASK